MEKEDERRRKEGEENEQQRGEEEKERAVEDFERVMNGLDGARKKSSGKVYDDANRGQDVRGVKRKFELDEEEMLKNAKEERARARRSIDEEKASYSLATTRLQDRMIDIRHRHPNPPSLLFGSLPSLPLLLRHPRVPQNLSNSTLSAPPPRKPRLIPSPSKPSYL